MREPWDRPEWEAWRVYCDALEESGAPAPERKRALRVCLGLRRRPRLALMGEVARDGLLDYLKNPVAVGRALFVSPVCRRWASHFSGLRWVTTASAFRVAARLGMSTPEAGTYFATPADFPGMLTPEWRSLAEDFYAKASEGIVVRCQKGLLSYSLDRRRRGAPRRWQAWEGVLP